MSKKRTTVRVCQNYSCVENGAETVMKKIESETGLEPGEQNKKYDIDFACCLGCCDFGPNMLVNDSLVLNVKAETVMDQIDQAGNEKLITQQEKEEQLNNILEDLL
jgi:NADH:ubiquinone oxidoreductase subunit E